MKSMINYKVEQIGIIKTPYKNSAPYQPIDSDKNEFIIELKEEYIDGIKDLEKFNFIYVIFYMHRMNEKVKMTISPSWTEGENIGIFASRSPVRPNPIGLSIVRLKKIDGNKIYTSGLDVFDGTPLIDIKPYIKSLDEKSSANYGWIYDVDDKEHLALHIKGIPHNH